jgi:hypothetical protein
MSNLNNKIKNSNITLRPLTQGDIHVMTKWLNNQEISRYLQINYPVTERNEREWLKNIKLKKAKKNMF